MPPFVLVILLSGCNAFHLPQPEIHPIAGKSIMFIPEGCRIGEIETSENGVYFGESVLIEIMRMEEEKRKEEKRKREKDRVKL